MKKESQEKLLIIIFILFSFLDSITVFTVYNTEFRSVYLLWPFFILLSLYLLCVKAATDRVLLAFFATVSFFGIYSFIITDFSKFLIVKQLLLWFATFFSSIFVFYYVKKKPVSFLRLYFEFCYLISFIGLIQILGFIVGIEFLYDFSYLGLDMGNLDPIEMRLQSIFSEPSFFAYATSIAAYLSILRVLKYETASKIKFYKAIIIIAASLLTLSLVVYMFILLSAIYIYVARNSILKLIKYSIFPLILLSILLSLLFNFNSVFQTKIVETISLIKQDKIYKPEKYNLSSYALISNLKIAEHITTNNFLGAGLGAYEQYYDKFIFDVVERNEFSEEWQLNKKDGASLLIRLWVELGPVITCLLIVILLYFKVSPFKKENISDSYYNSLLILNDAIFILILVRFLRQGHYTIFSFILFILIYFYSAIYIKKKRKLKRLSELK